MAYWATVNITVFDGIQWMHVTDTGLITENLSTQPTDSINSMEWSYDGNTFVVRQVSDPTKYLQADLVTFGDTPYNFPYDHNDPDKYTWMNNGDTEVFSFGNGLHMMTTYNSYFVDVANFPDVPIVGVVCFLEGTTITTDQGPTAIEQLTPNNTIFGSKVNNITESDNYFGHLIHFKANALANKLPSIDTFVSPTHAIFCPKDKQMKMAKDFCDGENVVEDYTKDKNCKIYNVVCQDNNGEITAHSMYVNNMLCECLHPHAYPLVKNQLKW